MELAERRASMSRPGLRSSRRRQRARRWPRSVRTSPLRPPRVARSVVATVGVGPLRPWVATKPMRSSGSTMAWPPVPLLSIGALSRAGSMREGGAAVPGIEPGTAAVRTLRGRRRRSWSNHPHPCIIDPHVTLVCRDARPVTEAELAQRAAASMKRGRELRTAKAKPGHLSLPGGHDGIDARRDRLR